MMINVYALTTSDVVRWQAILPAHRSIFGSVEYAAIAEQQTGYTARLFVVEADAGVMAYPLLLRPIPTLPFAARHTALWDTLTPEYTGPLVVSGGDSTLDAVFRERFAAYCRAEGIVAEFAHLHPWDGRPDLVGVESVVFDREIVYIDVTLSDEQLWAESFAHACRKNIRRAEQAGVGVVTAQNVNDIKEFYRIYAQTMDRNHANAHYYFSLDYFVAFFEQNPDHARFALATYRGEVIAGTLYVHDDMNVYAYLGGANHAFQDVRPTNAIIYDTIRWARVQGKCRLILGGGYRPDDGIMRFKGTFSPLRARFHTARQVHLPNTYGMLCADWADYYGCPIQYDGYFPAYRATPVEVSYSGQD